MSKITNDDLTGLAQDPFIAVPIWQWSSKG